MNSPGDPPSTTRALDAASVREAVLEVLRGHEAELRQCVQDALVAHPELLALEGVNVTLPTQVEALLSQAVVVGT